jgi:predicted dehydrogenase
MSPLAGAGGVAIIRAARARRVRLGSRGRRDRIMTLHWGIIGTGNIAHTFLEGLASCATGRLVAVASRTRAKADAFVAELPPGSDVAAHGSYDDLLADPRVEAVYISTPHPQHLEWAVKAARAGKHVLCEKPIGLNHREAGAIVGAAREHGVFLMEAFMYRAHPQTARLVELVQSGVIGEVRMIQAAFGFRAPFDPASRLFNNALAGGGILDVGCYPVSASRLVAGAATGQAFADPVEVKGVGHLGQTGIDEYAAAVMRFPNDILATVATGVSLEQENVLRVFGTDGHLFVPKPWAPAREGGQSEIIVQRTGEPARAEVIESPRHLYAYEIDAVAEGVERLRSGPADDPLRGQARPPCMTWADTLGNAAALDAWRASFGFRYEAERGG